jgi:hypothetical protein
MVVTASRCESAECWPPAASSRTATGTTGTGAARRWVKQRGRMLILLAASLSQGKHLLGYALQTAHVALHVQRGFTLTPCTGWSGHKPSSCRVSAGWSWRRGRPCRSGWPWAPGSWRVGVRLAYAPISLMMLRKARPGQEGRASASLPTCWVPRSASAWGRGGGGRRGQPPGPAHHGRVRRRRSGRGHGAAPLSACRTPSPPHRPRSPRRACPPGAPTRPRRNGSAGQRPAAAAGRLIRGRDGGRDWQPGRWLDLGQP